MISTPNEQDRLNQRETNLPKLLQLPLELRQQIYAYLCPCSSISNPIPSVGITSLSHTPPPLPLLLTSRAISLDILTYFYTLATWKLIASHAFNFYRIDPTLSNFASSYLLGKLQKVELVFWFDGALLKSYPSLKTSTYCLEIKKRAIRACEILATAPALRVVVVSWVDTTIEESIEEKKEVLDALKILDGRVRFEIGVLEWSGAQAGVQREEFDRKVKGLLRDVRSVAAA
jgi:hypothetical protein